MRRTRLPGDVLSTRTVRVGLVGCGGVGRIHLTRIAELPDIEVAGLTDINPHAAQRAAADFGVGPVFDTLDDLLADDSIEGVLVCTPTALHAAPTIAALTVGRHVFVEKPMATTVEEATAMVAAAEGAGRILHVGLKLRFAPELLVAKQIIGDGALGNVFYGEAVSDRRRGVPGGTFVRRALAGAGACADLGIYPLDVCLHLLGAPRALTVSALTSSALSRSALPVAGQWAGDVREEMEVEDFAAAWIRFEDGMTLLLKTSWAQHLNSLGGTFLLGDRGGLRLGFHEVAGRPGIQLYRDEFGVMTEVVPAGIATVDNAELFRRELTAFAAAIRDETEPAVDPHEAVTAISIIESILRSAAEGGREVEVAPFGG